MPSLSSRLPRPTAVLDALTYALTISAITLIGSFVLSVLTGGGAARANIFLFFTGWGLMAYATVRLWPSKKAQDANDDSGTESSLPSDHESRLQGYVRKLPPVRWVRLPPPAERIPLRAQLFLGSICVLALSYLLETVFNVM